MPLLDDPAVAPGTLARLAQPVLYLHDVVLRPWRASDAAVAAEACSEPSIQHWHARSMTKDEARAWIDSLPGRWDQESGGGWAVVNPSGLLGQISLRREPKGRTRGSVVLGAPCGAWSSSGNPSPAHAEYVGLR